MHADRRVARARAARDEADARPAAQLALRLGHVARAALLPAGDEADPLAVLVEAVERGEEALAGNAEGGVDALGDQRLDEGVAGGTGAEGGGGHGVARQAAAKGRRECASPAQRQQRRAQGSSGCVQFTVR